LLKSNSHTGRANWRASRLGEANINIQYAYCGVEPRTNASLLIFGVAEVGKAAAILDQTAAVAAGN